MKALNFNDAKLNTWEVTFPDKEQTTLHLMMSVKENIDELLTMSSQIENMVGNEEDIKAFYKLAALLISTNKEGRTVSPEELENDFNFGLVELITFFVGYLEFVKEIQNIKN